MATINPYLNFPGNTEEAFTFYKSVFGGKLIIQRFKDTPECDTLPLEDRDKVMHAVLPIGGNLLMATDALESTGHALTVGNNISMSLITESEAESDELFAKLSAGGTVTMPLQKTFWNAYFGALTDKFGIQWMVNYDYGQ